MFNMRRREFITLLGGAAAGWPVAARAQQTDRIRRIGILFGGFNESDPEVLARVKVFRLELEQLGWVEGRNIRFDLRAGAGDTDRIRSYAEELIGMMPDVLMANAAPAVIALARQTKTMPIVFANFFDPIGSGLVASFARPGGNVTGFSNFDPAMTGKWMQLLTEIAPNLSRVTAIFDNNATYAEFTRTAEKLASSFHLQYVPAPVSNTADVERAIAAAAQESNSGLIVMGGTVASANREAIVRLTAQYRLPTLYSFPYYVTGGGLASYGVDGIDLWRRAATYVDRILKGASPADLPVQLPTKFELLINLSTAKALGLTIPQPLLATADQVIE
jgi:putative tryptophan/tyrosine transport system substrate-binding protein